MDRTVRRLAAILAADVVGYSGKIEADESSTLAALKDIRATTIDPLLAENSGRIVKTMGDGFIAEFGSVVDAVTFAVAMQKSGRDASKEPRRKSASSTASGSISATWWSRVTICSATASTSRRGWSRFASRGES